MRRARQLVKIHTPLNQEEPPHVHRFVSGYLNNWLYLCNEDCRRSRVDFQAGFTHRSCPEAAAKFMLEDFESASLVQSQRDYHETLQCKRGWLVVLQQETCRCLEVGSALFVRDTCPKQRLLYLTHLTFSYMSGVVQTSLP